MSLQCVSRGPALARRGLLALALVAAGASVRGDIVHLKSGRTIEGSTAPGSKPGTIEVRRGEGVVLLIPEADIERIEKRISPLEEFEARWRAAPTTDVGALREVLSFAREKGLPGKAKLVAKKILEIDPNDAVARAELGYVVFENRWVLESDLKKRKGLVRHQGEWMTEAERDRRLREDGRKEMEELLDMADSENAYVQEFSIRRALSRTDPAALEVFAAHVRDTRRIPRMVAIRGLLRFPVAGDGDEPSRKLAADLHRMALEETDPDMLKVLYPTLGKYFPRESFRLALATATGPGTEKERRRAGEVLYYALRKEFVPELCRAVGSGGGNAVVRDVLKRALGVDQGLAAAAWLRYWSENSGRFSDE